MLKGTVKWFNSKKGYGFIRPDESDKDVFVHINSLEKSGIRNHADVHNLNFEFYDDRGKKAAGNISLL